MGNLFASCNQIKIMKPEQQNIAIAQVCGWKVENYGPTGYEKLYWRLCRPDGTIRIAGCTGGNSSKAMFGHLVPNYCNDLNAINEAENKLNYDNFVGCIRNLCILLDPTNECPSYDLEEKVSRATARQRAEAFLRTLNLWQES